MSEAPKRPPAWLRIGSAFGILLLGLLLGAALSTRLHPPAREPALLWDDYIVAVAALYQREGDLEAARERLKKLPTDDPTRSVAVLATTYAPATGEGERSAAALRDLATALTGRPFVATAQTAAETAQLAPLPSLLDSALPIARNDVAWVVLGALSVAWLGLTYARDRRSACTPAAVALAGEGREKAAAAAKPGKRRADARRATERAKAAPVEGARGRGPVSSLVYGERVGQDSLAVAFAYRGGAEPVEEMVTIADPTTGRVIAGCGMTNGPAPAGRAGGYLGFLVWLHELGSREAPQAVGLVAEGAPEHNRDAIAEWTAYAKLDELVVARPGIIRTFETNRLRAAVTVSEVAYSTTARQQQPVLGRLAVRLDISFKHVGAATPRRPASDL